MNHPTFDTVEAFWEWWNMAVVDGVNYRFAMAILQCAKLRIMDCLEKRTFLTDTEQDMIVEAARELVYFNPPAS